MKNIPNYLQLRIATSKQNPASSEVAKNQNKINSRQVLGDINQATLDPTYNLLDKTKLPDYDLSKMSYAYLSAFDSLTPNPEQAKNSYANMGLARQEFTFRNAPNTYTSREAALEARESLHNVAQMVTEAKILHPDTSLAMRNYYFNLQPQRTRKSTIKN